MADFYDIEAEDVMCDVHKMKEYKGKVVLIVNTATQCGFTPQYDDLQNIYEKYQQEGLEILDFPCNQFGNQAPESNEDIVSFCDAKFGITFKHYAKIDVNGENETPAALISASAVSTTNFLTYFSSLISPTSGIMISGLMVHSG